jgi:RHS repeat-associated protein
MSTKTKGKTVSVTGDSTKGNTPGSPVAQQVGAIVEGAGMGMSSASDKENGAVRCTNGHPVDTLTGEVIDEMIDLALPGLIPIEWKRYYCSSWAEEILPFGRGGWTYNWNQWVEVDGNQVRLRDGDGRYLKLGEIEPGGTGYLRSQGLEISRSLRDRFEIKLIRNGYIRVFSKQQEEGKIWLEQVRDARENHVDFIYENERLVTIIDTAKREIRVLWDKDHRVERVEIWAQGKPFRHIDYSYHDSGELAQAKNVMGHADFYEYDLHHRMVKTTLKNGVSFYYLYATEGDQCVKTWGDGGLYEYSFERDPENHMVTTTGSLETRIYTFNEQNQLIEEKTFDESWIESKTYDEDMLLLTESNAAGQTTTYEYDERGNQIAITDPAGNTVRWSYENDVIVKRISPDGLETTYQYNAYSEVTNVTFPNQDWVSIEYDPNGRVIGVFGQHGLLEGMRYDQDSNIMQSTDARGSVWTFTHNELGYPLSQTDPLGNVTKVEWNEIGQLIVIHKADGSQRAFAYDPLGNVVQRTDELGNMSVCSYVGTGELSAYRDAQGNQWELRYDTLERLREIRNPKGERYELRYDRSGRIVEERTFDGRNLVYRYGSHDYLRRLENPDGTWREFEYDPLGNVIEERSSHGTHVLERDQLGRILKATVVEPRETIEVEFGYDPFGQLSEERQGKHVVSYTYDQFGRRISRRIDEGHVTEYEYDIAGLWKAIAHDGKRFTFHRDALGRETRLLGSNQLTAIDSEYDVMNRLTGQKTIVPGQDALNTWQTLSERRWSYDAAGKVQEFSDSQWGMTLYRYNRLGEVLSAQRGAYSEIFDYEINGSVRSAQRTFSEADLVHGAAPWRLEQGNVLRRTDEASFEVDDCHRRIQKRDLSTGELTKYVWDCRHRLRDVFRADGTKISFTYDAFGRRVKKYVSQTIPDPEHHDSWVDYVWDGDVIAGEFHSERGPRIHVHNQNDLVPCLQAEQGEVFMVVTDHLGIPKDLVDEQGRVAWTAAHGVWGNVVEEKFDTKHPRTHRVASPFRHVGQIWDEETNLCSTRFRYWDNDTCCWISPDPMGIMGGSNLFAFDGFPLTDWDPFGLSITTENAAELRANMAESGVDSPFKGAAAHHIVEGSDSRMDDVRAHVETHLGSINHEENGVFLAPGSAARRSLPSDSPHAEALPHSWCHNDTYREFVRREIMACKTRTGIIRKLRMIRGMIMASDERLMTEAQKKRRKAQDEEDKKKKKKKSCTGA